MDISTFSPFKLRPKLRTRQLSCVALFLVWTAIQVVPAIAQDKKLITTNRPNGDSPVGSPFLLSNCTVFAIDAIELPSQETGILTAVQVRPGQEIEAGQRIATLDDATVRMEETIAMFEARMAREMAIDNTDIRFAEAVVQESKIALDAYREIEARGSASEAEMRSKILTVEQAELKLQHAKVAQKQLEVKNLLAGTRSQAIHDRLQRYQILTPFAGMVTTVDKHQGEWVQAGQSIASIVRLDELRVDSYIAMQLSHPSKLIGKSVSVSVQIDGPETPSLRLGGRITHYDPDVTSDGKVRIHATVQNARHNGFWQLLPGMSVSMNILN